MASDQVVEGQKANKFILSEDPNQAMLEMMQALDALRVVYDEENDALVSADTRRFMDLQERKIEAAQRYHDTAAQVIEHREELKAADPVLRQRLQDMHGDFTIMTEKNLGHIDRMNKSVKRLSERVVKSARDAALRDSASYSRRGTLYHNNRPVSTGLNESA
jgi:hypothetical protein